MGSLGNRPVMLIHGGSDSRVPLVGSQRLLANAMGPKELWVVPEAGHLEAFTMNPQVYLERLTTFLARSLRARRAVAG